MSVLRISLISLALYLNSCRSAESGVKNFTQDTLIIEQTPCFGTCPQYTMTLTGNGSMLYEGKRFTEMNGTWTATATSQQIESLFLYLNKQPWNEFQSEYPSPYSDLPSTILKYTNGKNRYEVKITGDHPTEIDSMIINIRRLEKEVQWQNQNLK